MSLLNRLKFRTKINLGIISLVAFVAVVLALAIGRLAARDMTRESKKRGLVMAENLANQAAEPILSGDLLRLKNMVDETKRVDEDVEYAFLLDVQGNVLAHTFRNGFPVALKGLDLPQGPCRPVLLLDTGETLIYDFSACVRVGRDMIGVARVGLSRPIVLKGVDQLMVVLVCVSVGALVVAVSLGAFFSGQVTRRLKTLQQQATDMVRGNLDLKASLPQGADVQESRGDEIQDLSETFEFMSLNLKAYINDLKEAKERLLAQQDQLIQSQKMESLGKLSGGVAHEINTPLGIILGYAQLLQEDVDKGSQIHADLQTIEKQTKVCRKIVSDLLGFSRQTQSRKFEMCLNHTLLETLSLMRNTLFLQKVEVIKDMDENLPYIVADPEKLKQVWMNLYSNALDAMSEGGLLKVLTRVDMDNERVLVLVADTGSGIDEQEVTKVFDPFFSTKPVGKGTGLGLSVSFGIIEDHFGEIRAKSPVPEGIFTEEEVRGRNLGPGTLFTVDLPIDCTDPEEWE